MCVTEQPVLVLSLKKTKQKNNAAKLFYEKSSRNIVLDINHIGPEAGAHVAGSTVICFHKTQHMSSCLCAQNFLVMPLTCGRYHFHWSNSNNNEKYQDNG